MSILDYIKGFRKGKEAHRIELEAMKDPFLSEALEGFDQVQGNHEERIRQMQEQIRMKTTGRTNKKYIWSAAAVIILCIGIGGFFWTENRREPVMYSASKLKNEPMQPLNIDFDTVGKAVESAEPAVVLKDRAEKQVFSDAERIIMSDLQPVGQAEEVTKVPAVPDEMPAAPELLSLEVIDLKLPDSLSNKTSVSNVLSGKVAGVSVAASTTRNGVVRGKITDESGDPLIGVALVQKNSGKGAITDVEGRFSLYNADMSEPITASYIGYRALTIPVDTSRQLALAMHEDNNQLDEVVVVGYGAQKKKDITSACQRVVSSDDDYTPEIKKSEPVIGMKQYKEYLKENRRLASDSNCRSAKGKVELRFRVNSSGRPYNITVKKSLCLDADNEAIRLINEGCDWTEGDNEVKIKVEF